MSHHISYVSHFEQIKIIHRLNLKDISEYDIDSTLQVYRPFHLSNYVYHNLQIGTTWVRSSVNL
jgi:hypothetical protein